MEKIIKFKDFKLNETLSSDNIFPLSMKEVFKKQKQILYINTKESKYIDNPHYVESTISRK